MTEGITFTAILAVIVLLGCIGGMLIAAALGTDRAMLPGAIVIMVALCAAMFGGQK